MGSGRLAVLPTGRLADSFTLDVLRGILADAGRAQLKGVLRSQSVIAGIGNAYSDELLHAARLSPFKPASSLTDDETRTLYDAIKGVLSDAVSRSLGLAATAGPDELRAAASDAMARWQRRAENPLSSASLTDASRLLVRTCEGILTTL